MDVQRSAGRAGVWALVLGILVGPAARGADGAGDVQLVQVEVNGIQMRVAQAGRGPAVLLLHGFPEGWYSWRHQLRALSSAGYRAIAPDMRGYGGTDAPAATEAYDALDLCGDVTALLDHLGEERAVLVGHDWGAAVAWYCALLEPARFRAVVAMSVPWGPRKDTPPLAALRQAYGDRFFYMLYFQEPGVAEAELDADPEGLLRRLLISPDTPRQPPEITDPRAGAGGLLGRLGLPTELPPWLSEDDLEHYVAEFRRTGFHGGLSYYRNLDRDWELTPQLASARIEVPVLFLAGEKDLVLGGRSRDEIEGPMRQVAPDLRGVHLLAGAGHWIQQERADEVNGLLLAFLASVPAGQRTAPNPAAPPETAQFDFLIGRWDCRTRFLGADGRTYVEGTATWTGRYILDGWAIQDDWVSVGPDGSEFHGTNIRSFNPQTAKWDNRWLPLGSLQWKYYEAERHGETMVMIGGAGSDARGAFLDRNVFHDITAGSWQWRKDRSYDGGTTWLEGIGFIEAKRSREPPAPDHG